MYAYLMTYALLMAAIMITMPINHSVKNMWTWRCFLQDLRECVIFRVLFERQTYTHAH